MAHNLHIQNLLPGAKLRFVLRLSLQLYIGYLEELLALALMGIIVFLHWTSAQKGLAAGATLASLLGLCVILFYPLWVACLQTELSWMSALPFSKSQLLGCKFIFNLGLWVAAALMASTLDYLIQLHGWRAQAGHAIAYTSHFRYRMSLSAECCSWVGCIAILQSLLVYRAPIRGSNIGRLVRSRLDQPLSLASFHKLWRRFNLQRLAITSLILSSLWVIWMLTLGFNLTDYVTYGLWLGAALGLVLTTTISTLGAPRSVASRWVRWVGLGYVVVLGLLMALHPPEVVAWLERARMRLGLWRAGIEFDGSPEAIERQLNSNLSPKDLAHWIGYYQRHYPELLPLSARDRSNLPLSGMLKRYADQPSLLLVDSLFNAATYSPAERAALNQALYRAGPLSSSALWQYYVGHLRYGVSLDELWPELQSANPYTVGGALMQAGFEQYPDLIPLIEARITTWNNESNQLLALKVLSLLYGHRLNLNDWADIQRLGAVRSVARPKGPTDCSSFRIKRLTQIQVHDLGVLNQCLRQFAPRRNRDLVATLGLGWIDLPLSAENKLLIQQIMHLRIDP